MERWKPREALEYWQEGLASTWRSLRLVGRTGDWLASAWNTSATAIGDAWGWVGDQATRTVDSWLSGLEYLAAGFVSVAQRRSKRLPAAWWTSQLRPVRHWPASAKCGPTSRARISQRGQEVSRGIRRPAGSEPARLIEPPVVPPSASPHLNQQERDWYAVYMLRLGNEMLDFTCGRNWLGIGNPLATN